METLSKLSKEKEEWKCMQQQMTTDIEKLLKDNLQLRAAEEQRHTEVQS
jgi:hypothetical protein